VEAQKGGRGTVGRLVIADLHHFDEEYSRIRILIKEKSWIRILIKVKRQIQIRIELKGTVIWGNTVLGV
jgi:hypothetical protein